VTQVGVGAPNTWLLLVAVVLALYTVALAVIAVALAIGIKRFSASYKGRADQALPSDVTATSYSDAGFRLVFVLIAAVLVLLLCPIIACGLMVLR
jgi:hypothetical protein